MAFDAFADHLGKAIERVGTSFLAKRTNIQVANWTRDIHCMVMDNDTTTTDQLRALIAVVSHPKIQNSWRSFSVEDRAIKEIREHTVCLDVVFLDIDMYPNGHNDAGYRVYEEILKRNRDVAIPTFRVKAVFFFTKGNPEHDQRTAKLHARFPGNALKPLLIPKTGCSDEATQQERIKVAEKIIREIGRLKPE
jgi:hypothetical protein